MILSDLPAKAGSSRAGYVVMYPGGSRMSPETLHDLPGKPVKISLMIDDCATSP